MRETALRTGLRVRSLWVLLSVSCSLPTCVLAGDRTDAGWLAGVRQDLAEREYDVTWQDRPALPDLGPSWHAPNRAQKLRTYFTPEGIRVTSRTAADPTWELGLSLVGYGRGRRSWVVPDARLAPEGSRVVYRRGPLEESYDNRPRGLEQRFVLSAPPGRGASNAAPKLVHLDLAVTGGLVPVIAEDARAVEFATPDGAPVVRQSDLRATDAHGETIPAWVEGLSGDGERGVRLVLDARGSAYPIAIETLTTTADWTADSSQIGALFGSSVASAGDVNNDGFDDVIVGAYYYDNGQADEGGAFVYYGSALGPSKLPDWSAEGGQANAYFGISVSGAGDVNRDGYSDVIIGANAWSGGQLNEGRALVYHGSAAGLETTPAWTAESNSAEAYFGASVAGAGDVNHDTYDDVIVGAYNDTNGETGEGKAFVYLGSPSGLLTAASWTAEGNQEGAAFGISVAGAGDVNGDNFDDVVVGAYRYNNNLADEGTAFVYHGSATGLQATASWTGESNQEGAYYGLSVSGAGDVNGDGFDDVIIGAQLYDNGENDEGRAFLYRGSPSGLDHASWTAEGNEAGAAFGSSVSAAGDVNDDGYDDVVVGAYLHDNGESDEGGAFVYYGSPTGLGTTPAWTAEADQDTAFFGISASGAGDVNGDGYADVIVGAYAYDNGQTDEGAAFVYYGAATSAAGRVPDGSTGAPLLLQKAGGAITLAWGASCLTTDTDYAIYEGTIGDFTSHTSRFCTTDGAMTKTFVPLVTNAYYLVVPLNGVSEGSYGETSGGAERPPGQNACLPQQIASCP